MLRRWYGILLLPHSGDGYVARLDDSLALPSIIESRTCTGARFWRDFVANFAEELTEIVGIRLIDQIQESIQQGDVTRWRCDEPPPFRSINTLKYRRSPALLHI